MAGEMSMIPPLLPWQINADVDNDGTYAPEGFAATGTLTVPAGAGSLAVTATFTSAAGVRATTFYWGDGTAPTTAAANVASHTFKAAGTYTVQCSDGVRNGSATVTVPGVVEDAKRRARK